MGWRGIAPLKPRSPRRADWPRAGRWLDRVRDDLENYRSAMSWLIERGPAPLKHPHRVWAEVLSGDPGHATEGLQWYQEILKLPALPPAAELRTLAGAIVLWYTQGELDTRRSAAHARPFACPCPDDMVGCEL